MVISDRLRDAQTLSRSLADVRWRRRTAALVECYAAEEGQDGQANDSDDEQDDAGERAERIAQLFAAIYGPDAERMLLAALTGEDVAGDDADADAAGEPETYAAFDPSRHPRGPGGRFIPRNSPEAVATAKQQITRALSGPRTADSAQELLQHLNLLSVRQIQEVARSHMLRSTGRVREDLVRQLADHLDRGRREAPPTPRNDPPAPAPSGSGPGDSDASIPGHYGPHVKSLGDGRVAGPALLTADQLRADPKRFQYKISGIGEEGVTQELKDVKKYNPDYGGQLLVWHDPADGQAYVVNGHHRFELAKRSGYADPLAVRFVNAKSPAAARAVGAMANIAEGRGTALDAAKFLRDADMTPEDLAASGVSLKGRIADQGKTLAKLSDKIFNRLAGGAVPEGRALAIAANTADHAQQDAVLKAVEAEDARRREPVRDDAVARIAKRAALAGSRRTQGQDLFGDWEDEESLLVPRAELESHVLRTLRDEANTFKAVSSSRRQNKLEAEGRNTIDAAGNQQRSREAAGMAELFDQQANLKGEVSDLLNTAAKEYADANARGKDRIRRQLVDDLAQRLRPVVGRGKTGSAGGTEDYSASPGGRRLDRETEAVAAGLTAILRRRERRDRLARRHLQSRTIAERLQEHLENETYAAGRRSKTPSVESAAAQRELRERLSRALATVGGGPERYMALDRRSLAERLQAAFRARWSNDAATTVERYVTDDSGHEHRGKGPGGGQFVGKGGGDSGKSAETGAGKKQESAQPAGGSLELHRHFTPEENALPEKTTHRYKREETAYMAAWMAHRPFRGLLQSTAAGLGGTAVETSDKAAMQQALARTGHVSLVAGLKGTKRAREKVARYGGNWSKMSDLVRGTLAVDHHGQIGDAVNQLRTHLAAHGWEHAARPEDRMSTTMDDSGYRDLTLKLRHKGTGMTAELQVNTKAMLAAKEVAHKLFEVNRTIKEQAQKEDRDLTPQEARQIDANDREMRRLYAEGWAASQPPMAG